jgi:hypothetical protein
MAGDVQSDLRHPVVLVTALVAVCLWAAAACRMLRMRAGDWRDGSRALRPLRAGWLAGWLLLQVHVAAAFHLAHGWSHAAAYRHTEEVSGVGAGIFVSYLFGLVWGVDAAWLAGFPASYARRPRWVGWAVHGFLAFIVFNATVVYGTGVARWLGLVVFAALGWIWLRKRGKRWHADDADFNADQPRMKKQG